MRTSQARSPDIIRYISFGSSGTRGQCSWAPTFAAVLGIEATPREAPVSYNILGLGEVVPRPFGRERSQPRLHLRVRVRYLWAKQDGEGVEPAPNQRASSVKIGTMKPWWRGHKSIVIDRRWEARWHNPQDGWRFSGSSFVSFWGSDMPLDGPRASLILEGPGAVTAHYNSLSSPIGAVTAHKLLDRRASRSHASVNVHCVKSLDP